MAVFWSSVVFVTGLSAFAASTSTFHGTDTQSADILDEGVVLRGKATQEDMKDAGQTITFEVSSPDGLVLLRTKFDKAFPEASTDAKTEVAAFMFRRLLKHVTAGAHTTVRFAQRREDLAPNTFILDEHTKAVVCIVSPKEEAFLLQCVDGMTSHLAKAGDPFLMQLAVIPRRDSPVSAYLRRHRSVLIRIED